MGNLQLHHLQRLRILGDFIRFLHLRLSLFLCGKAHNCTSNTQNRLATASEFPEQYKVSYNLFYITLFF